MLTRSIVALRRHIYLEEEVLFPLLHDAGLAAPIFVMLREHAQIWQALDSVEGGLSGAERPTDATLLLVRQLGVQLEHHNMKEERVVYPPADQVLTRRWRLGCGCFSTPSSCPRDGFRCSRAAERHSSVTCGRVRRGGVHSADRGAGRLLAVQQPRLPGRRSYPERRSPASDDAPPVVRRLSGLVRRPQRIAEESHGDPHRNRVSR